MDDTRDWIVPTHELIADLLQSHGMNVYDMREDAVYSLAEMVLSNISMQAPLCEELSRLFGAGTARMLQRAQDLHLADLRRLGLLGDNVEGPA